MAVVSKINPVGIDKPIDIIQKALFDGLVTNGSFVDYTVYPRVYINESKNGIKPENYTSKNEYKDVFVDDGHALSSFVIVDPTRDSTTTTNFTPNISIIFQARLDKLITGITHRPDEEFNNQVAVILNRLRSRGIILEGLVTGLENVYAEFDTTSVKWDDMNPFYVVRFNLTVSNSYDCALVLQAPTTSPCTLTALVTVENESGEDADDGTAIATATTIGGAGPFTYSWTGPNGFTSTLQAVIGLAPGTYEVTITDLGAASCTATDSGTVDTDGDVCNLIIDDIESTPASSPIALDGTATVTFSGEVGPVTFLWSNEETVNPAIALPVGLASVLVTDAGVSNCSQFTSINVGTGAPLIVKTQRGVDTDFEVEYMGIDDPVWTSVSLIEGTIVEVGAAVTFNFTVVEEHVVTLTVNNPIQITELGDTFDDGVIDDSFNGSGLVGISGVVDLANNPNATEFVSPISTGLLTDLRMGFGGWVNVDISAMTLGTNVRFPECPDLETISLGVQTNEITFTDFEECRKLVELDFSGWSNHGGLLKAKDCDVLAVVKMGSGGGVWTKFELKQGAFAELDLTNETGLAGEFLVYSIPELLSLTLPVSTGLFGSFWFHSTNVGFVLLTTCSGILGKNSSTVLMINMNLTVGEVNNYLADMVVIVSAQGALSSRSIRIESNVAPDSGIAVTNTVVNQGTKTFSVAGDQTLYFRPRCRFTITGSTGNDGTYTIVSSSFGADTDIIVEEVIPNATADGTITTPDGSASVTDLVSTYSITVTTS